VFIAQSRQISPVFLFILELSPIPLLKFGLWWNVDFMLMVTHLNGRMVNTRNGRGDLEPALPNGNPPHH
jgi:hypothetical protein